MCAAGSESRLCIAGEARGYMRAVAYQVHAGSHLSVLHCTFVLTLSVWSQFADVRHLEELMGWGPYGTSIAVSPLL